MPGYDLHTHSTFSDGTATPAENVALARERRLEGHAVADDGPAYVPKHALAPVDALALIRDAGGACVLAHPGMWRGADSVPDALIEEMAADGMAGIEVDHPDQDEEQRSSYRVMAERLGLVPTGASDCHGARYDFRLGSETTPPDLVDELHRRAGS